MFAFLTGHVKLEVHTRHTDGWVKTPAPGLAHALRPNRRGQQSIACRGAKVNENPEKRTVCQNLVELTLSGS
jgi:hypothetical protein